MMQAGLRRAGLGGIGWAALVAACIVAGDRPALAQAPGLSAPEAMSAQSRPRARIRVQPQQPAASPYPRPGEYSWPGPGAVRLCEDWYALENRPSGTVLTPQMRCRWVRG